MKLTAVKHILKGIPMDTAYHIALTVSYKKSRSSVAVA